jgi:plastocyanin
LRIEPSHALAIRHEVWNCKSFATEETPRMRLMLPLACALTLATSAFAADTPTYSLTIQNRAFAPSELQVPAGQQIELHVKNADAAASEFESHTLHREKVVPAGKEVVVQLGPLRAGTYEFFDDFNPKARGHIVAQ